MPQLNIHWKGYPHHYPFIRTASQNTLLGAQNRGQIAAQDVTQLPFAPALENARLQQRLRTTQRARHRLRASSQSVLKKRKASNRTKHHVHIFERESTRTSLAASLGTDENHSKCRSKNSRWCNPSLCVQGRSGVHSHRVSRRTKARLEEGQYLLMHVPETGVQLARQAFCASIKSKGNENQRGAKSTGIVREYAHVGPFGKVCHKSGHVCAATVNRSRSCDPRLQRKTIRHSSSSINALGDQTKMSRNTISASKCSSREHHSVLAKSSFENVSQASESESKARDSSTSHGEPPSFPSRSRSQQKALRRFARELEKQIVISKALRGTSLASSQTSSSCVSAHTVVEFIPYLAEFHAAGLAVTSTEQRKRSHRMSKELHKRLDSNENSCQKALASITGDEGAELVDEASNQSTEPADAQRHSSGSLVRVFPSQMELPILGTEAISSPWTSSTKRALPWLRKAETRNKNPHNVGKINKLSAQHEWPPSADTALTTTTRIIDFSPHSVESNNTQTMSDSKVPFLGVSDIQWIELEYSTNSPSPRKPDVGPPSRIDSPHSNLPQAPLSGLDGSRRETFPTETPIQSDRTKAVWSSSDATIDRYEKYELSTVPAKRPAKQTSKFSRTSAKSKTFTTKTDRASDSRTAGLPRAIGAFRPSQKLLDRQKAIQDELDTEITKVFVAEHMPENLSPPDRPPPPPPKCEQCQRKHSRKKANTSVDHKGTEQKSSNHFSSECRECYPSSKNSSEPCEQPKSTNKSLSIPTSGKISTGRLAANHRFDNTAILSGLQTAMAAANDKDVNSWIRKVSGCDVRQLLADLAVFEKIGADALKKIVANQKRIEDALMVNVVKRRQVREAESMMERAMAMGWRGRCVSAG